MNRQDDLAYLTNLRDRYYRLYKEKDDAIKRLQADGASATPESALPPLHPAIRKDARLFEELYQAVCVTHRHVDVARYGRQAPGDKNTRQWQWTLEQIRNGDQDANVPKLWSVLVDMYLAGIADGAYPDANHA